MKNFKEILISLVVMVAVYSASVVALGVMFEGGFQNLLLSYVMLTALQGGLLYASYRFILSPWLNANRPQNLSTASFKDLLQSKMFWVAVLSLVSVTIKGIFNFEIDEATQTEILNINYSNVLQAILSLAMIALRTFGMSKLIS